MSELEIVKFLEKLIIGTECNMEYVIRSIPELHNLYPWKLETLESIYMLDILITE